MLKLNRIILLTLGLFTFNVSGCSLTLSADDTVVIDKFEGLYTSPASEKTPVGSHSVFTNFYIKDGNIQNVKGRNRLDSSAHADAVVNGITYYENAAGSTKKIIVSESDEIVSYAVTGGSKTSLLGSLTNEPHDFVQIGDTLYIMSQTDGLIKWTGSGSAAAVGSISAPSTVDFSATTTAGGLTSGLDCIAACVNEADNLGTSEFVTCTSQTDQENCSTGVCIAGDNDSTCTINDDEVCVTKVNATNSSYLYKVTKYNSLLGIESEASTTDTALLLGNDNISVTCAYTDVNADTTPDAGEIYTQKVDVTGEQTATTGTLASAPSAPFDNYRVYRTVASGSEYFLVGQQSTGTFTDGKPDVSLGNPFDTTIDTITPPSYRYIESYKGTLFTAENQSIRFSRVPVNIPVVADTDTYWLNTDEIVLGAKKPITGLKSSSDSLLVFTESDTYEITGFGASTFQLSQLLKGIGSISDATIEEDENADLIFFGGTSGVFRLSTRSQKITSGSGDRVNQPSDVTVVKISSPAMDKIFQGIDSQIDLDPNDYSSSHAYYDIQNSLYFLFIDKHCFVYDEANNTWSYIPATKELASVYRKSPIDSGQGILVDNLGFFYNNWLGYENGIESGTVTGHPTSSGNTTLTDSTATFNTTNDGLKGVWVYLDNEIGEYRQISSNTGTALTVSSAWTVNPITSDTYYVAYIRPELQTKYYNLGKLIDKTLIKNAYIVHDYITTPSSQALRFYAWQDKSSTASRALDFTLGSSRVTAITVPLNSEWVKFGLLGYVYNTSETAESPINIITYGFKGTKQERQ